MEDIRNALLRENATDDIEIANTSLDVIEDELKQIQPRKKILEMALKSLEAIKGTVEFAAAVAALAQFIKLC